MDNVAASKARAELGKRTADVHRNAQALDGCRFLLRPTEHMTHLVEDAKLQIGFRTPASCVWLRQKFKYNFDHPDSQALLGGGFRVWGFEKLPLYLQFSGHSNVMLLYDDSKVSEGGRKARPHRSDEQHNVLGSLTHFLSGERRIHPHARCSRQVGLGIAGLASGRIAFPLEALMGGDVSTDTTS